MHLFAYQGGFRPYRQGFVDIFINVLKGLLVGIALGTLLGILSGSWVWLEMRVNVGRMIPAVMLVCLIIAVSKKAVFRYRFFFFF